MTTNTLKAILIIFFFNLCSLQSSSVKAQTVIDTTFEILKRIDYASYVRKPVDSLLSHIPNNSLSMKIIGHHKPTYGDELYIEYPNSVALYIKVVNFQYMDPKWSYNQTQPPWNISLFKKEAISFSSLTRGPICYVGCDDFYSH